EYRHWVEQGKEAATALKDFAIVHGATPEGANAAVSHISGPTVSLEVLIPTLLAMVIGSISFWGSNVAFAKLQELIPGQPLALPGQKIINVILLIGLLVGGIYLGINNEYLNLDE